MTAQTNANLTAAEIAVNAEIGIDEETADALIEEGNFEAEIDPRLAKLGALLDSLDGTDGEIAGLPLAEVIGDLSDTFGDINPSQAIRDLLNNKFGQDAVQAAYDQAFGATPEREAREPDFGSADTDDLVALLMMLGSLSSEGDDSTLFGN
jgi:hypothetical protein